MIKANELRIGNLVYDSAGNIHQINSIDSIEIGFTDGQSMYIVHSKPIKITEEWILKLGFKQIESTNEYKIIHYEYKNLGLRVFNESGFYFYRKKPKFTSDDDNYLILKQIYFVYELQNLCQSAHGF
jgi:hypothetical protein